MTNQTITPWALDKLGRRGVAKFLTSYLDSNEDINVLNVNAPWGAGKTFFLENWCAELRQERAVIIFNAWRHDFAGDAFIALTATINDSLLESIPLAGAEEKLKSFRKKATDVVLAATPALAKGVLKKVTGVDVAAISDAIDSEGLADAAEKALDELLKNNRQTMQTVQDFKDKFTVLAEEAALHKATSAGVERRPLYIFIDELDRCRPSFSIELLERIKHFFDVKGCKFIIACDLEQLQHSVGAVYGSGFEGAKYLKRFFDAEYSLDYTNIESWVKAQIIEDSAYADIPLQLHEVGRGGYFASGLEPIPPARNSVLDDGFGFNKFQIVLLAVAKTFKLKLRELEKCLKHVRAIHAAMQHGSFDFFLAIYLVALRDEAPQLYRRVIAGNDANAWEEIAGKYPPKYLYSGVSNDDVHSLASTYISFMGASKAELRRASHGSDIKPLRGYILDRFMGGQYDLTVKYPHYVDLAHSIE